MPAPRLEFHSNFKETEVALRRMNEGIPVKEKTILEAALPVLKGIQEEALRAATPENTRGSHPLSTFPEGDPPSLKDTTASTTTWQGSNQFEARALVSTFQTKTVPMPDGSRHSLADILVTGRPAPSETIRPVQKKALFWPRIEGGRPVASSRGGPAAPDDYFTKAREASRPALAEAGQEIARALGDVILRTNG